MKVIELFEDEYMAKQLDITDPDDIAKLLEKECSTFVNAYRSTHKVIFRGIRELTGDVEFAQALIRPDRKPIFMPSAQHDLINQAMIELGLKAHRGNSIFCTTSRYTAKEWGKIYSIFPVDGWAGTVFKKVKYGYVFDEIHDESDEIVTAEKEGKYDHTTAVDKMAAYLSNYKPHSFTSQNDLEVVINQSYEDILITGKKYYALGMTPDGDPKDKANDVFARLGI